jgi:DNA segregation ATPase FtsK/SpoIIIE, S-DNA-T family
MRTQSNKAIDSLFAQAANLIVERQQGSSSLLQRELKIGYNKAGELMDQLENVGIVGPFAGSDGREVRYKDIKTLEVFLSHLNK